MALANVLHGQALLVVFLFVDKLHVEALCHHRQHNLNHMLRESLPKANSFSAIEGKPGEGFALLA